MQACSATSHSALDAIMENPPPPPPHALEWHQAIWRRTMKSVFMGPTVISPVVTRLRWPPLMPLIIWLPTMVSAHTCPVTALSRSMMQGADATV